MCFIFDAIIASYLKQLIGLKMPFYEYQCQSCNEKVTLMQGIKDDPATVCPKCGKESLVRIISNTAFTLKGSG